MSQKTLWPPTKQVRGFTPALDRRQIPEPSVVAGKNFLIDAEGPYSAFGNRLPTYARVEAPELAASFRISGELFLLVNTGVLKYDTAAAAFYPVLVFANPSAEVFPWSYAVVGGKYYFAKKGHDLIQYTPSTQTWAELTANVPPGCAAVTSSNDRLIVLGSDRVARSAISDGADLATSTVTGAGFQLLALIGGGSPLGVRKIPTGYLVFTTEGIMLGESINAVVPFRHRALDHDYRPLDAFCIVEIEQSVVFLTKQGFYQSKGQQPTPFDEVMSEYFRRKILDRIDLDEPGILRLTYNTDRQWLVVSYSESEIPFKYSFAFVLYMPMRQWGLFNREHTSFVEILLSDGIDEGFNFGYFDFMGFFHKFTEDQYSEIVPTDLTEFLYYSDDLPTVSRYENGTIIFSSGMRIYDYPLYRLQEGVGLYDFNNNPVYSDMSTASEGISEKIGNDLTFRNLMKGGNGFVLYIPKLWQRIQGSIDSYIDVGIYRMSENQASDEISLVGQVMIGTDELGVQAVTEDWNIISPNVEEDWLNDELIDEDWGFGIASGTDFVAKLVGTVDGENPFNYDYELLKEYYQANKARYYPANTEGIYHIIRIEALLMAQSFHLKLQELSGMIVGRL